MAQAHHIALVRPLLALGEEKLYEASYKLRRDKALFQGAFQVHRAEAAENGVTRERFMELHDQAVVKQLLTGLPAMSHLDALIRLDKRE